MRFIVGLRIPTRVNLSPDLETEHQIGLAIAGRQQFG
jgi:hypothetical protein